MEAVYELRSLGFTDDDFVLIQQWFAEDLRADGIDGVTAGGSPADTPEMANLAARADELAHNGFASIEFLDAGTTDMLLDTNGQLPWASSCPETAAEFEFTFADVLSGFQIEVTDGTGPPKR